MTPSYAACRDSSNDSRELDVAETARRRSTNATQQPAKSKQAFDVLTKRLKLAGALVIDAKDNINLHRSVRNLAKFDVLPPEGLNLESVLRHKHLVVTSAAIKAIEGALS